MATNPKYLLNTSTANGEQLKYLYDIAKQAGVKNPNSMSNTELTTAIKKATGTSGNTIGGTIGNKTVNQYGYKVVNGQLVPTSVSTPAGTLPISSAGAANATVGGTGVTALPGYGDTMFDSQYYSDPWIYQQALANETAFQNGMDTLNNSYNQYVTTLNNGASGANAALDDARSNAIDQITRTYDDSARNYYRLYKRQEKDLPEQLSSVGATGGASESAALNLMNNYSDNLYKNEYGRNQQISGLNEDYYNAIAQNSQQLAQQIANAYLQLGNAQLDLQNQNASNKMSLLQNVQANIEAQKQKQAQAEIDNWNAMIAKKVAGRTSEGYDPQTWTDASGRDHYTIKGQTSKTDIAKANAATDKKIAELRAKGYKVYTYTNADGTKGYTYSAPKGKSKNKDKSKNDDDEAKPKTQTQGLNDKMLEAYANIISTKGVTMPNGYFLPTSGAVGINSPYIGVSGVLKNVINSRK